MSSALLEEIRKQAYTEGRPCDHTERRLPSIHQGETQNKPTLLTPYPWTSSLPNCEEINLLLSHLAWGTLLQQP
jgi:hypothetical protein